MKIAGIIPSRFASTRFPGKPLVEIKGIPMIERVYNQAAKSNVLCELIVATDDDRIFSIVQSFGGKAVMTDVRHRSGTERCAEVAEKARKEGAGWDAVINIQGDEPFLDPGQIDQVAAMLTKTNSAIATLVKPIERTDEITNPDVVKVVLDKFSRAIYFSRSVIPFCREQHTGVSTASIVYYKHVGIYGYHSEILTQLVHLPPSYLEIAESLEQLRWIFHGYHIYAGETKQENIAIDSPADLSKITNII